MSAQKGRYVATALTKFNLHIAAKNVRNAVALEKSKNACQAVLAIAIQNGATSAMGRADCSEETTPSWAQWPDFAQTTSDFGTG